MDESFKDTFESLEIENFVGQLVVDQQDEAFVLITKVVNTGSEVVGIKLTTGTEMKIGVKTLETGTGEFTPVGIRLEDIDYWEKVFLTRRVVYMETGEIYEVKGLSPDEEVVLVQKVGNDKLEKASMMYFKDMFATTYLNPPKIEVPMALAIPTPPANDYFPKPPGIEQFGDSVRGAVIEVEDRTGYSGNINVNPENLN